MVNFEHIQYQNFKFLILAFNILAGIDLQENKSLRKKANNLFVIFSI